MSARYPARPFNASGWGDLPEARTGEIGYRDQVADNTARASAGMAAIRLYAEQAFGTDEEVETALGDLLADLRHACDSLGIDFDAISEHGYQHYVAELHGEQ